MKAGDLKKAEKMDGSLKGAALRGVFTALRKRRRGRVSYEFSEKRNVGTVLLGAPLILEISLQFIAFFTAPFISGISRARRLKFLINMQGGRERGEGGIGRRGGKDKCGVNMIMTGRGGEGINGGGDEGKL